MGRFCLVMLSDFGLLHYVYVVVKQIYCHHKEAIVISIEYKKCQWQKKKRNEK